MRGHRQRPCERHRVSTRRNHTGDTKGGMAGAWLGGDALLGGPDGGLCVSGAVLQQSLPQGRTEGSLGVDNRLDLWGPEGQRGLWDLLWLQLCDTPQFSAPALGAPSGWQSGLPFCRLLSRSSPPGSLVSLVKSCWDECLVYVLTCDAIPPMGWHTWHPIKAFASPSSALTSSGKISSSALFQVKSHPAKISVMSSGLSGRSETPWEALKGR